MPTALRIATRKSALALWQARHVGELLAAAHPDLTIELVPMSTRGDRLIDRPLASIGGKGLFLKELETALLEGRADLAVHSMKDVPADNAPGLVFGAILDRADPGDALVSNVAAGIDDLASGARVGTSSLRRRCQLLALRPDLEVADLRGNVDTRLARLDAGEYDAIVLACAGLIRLGLAARISSRLVGGQWLSAPSQGAIGIQFRQDDDAVRARCQVLHHPATATCVAAERAFSARLEGSCQVPLAALANIENATISVAGMVGSPDGSCILRGQQQGSRDAAEDVGLALADELLQRGAGDILRRLSP